jgi:glyoxylase-like metal-dependent hydrolase (beta-lactamase superfamily II)
MMQTVRAIRVAIVVPAAALLIAGNLFQNAVASGGGRRADVKPLRLYVFDLGKLKVGDPTRFNLKKEELSPTEFFAVVGYLVVHPKGTVMWDTGVVRDEDVGTDARGAERAGRRLKDQLSEVGYAPKDITYLAISHYHNDHTANANAFAGSTWLVRRAEREAMFADPPPRIANPNDYSSLKISKTILLDQDEYDVFGDQTVVIKAAPGHTPAHQVLVLRLQKTGSVVLAGDLYHFVEERRLRDRVPIFEFDKEQSIASRNMIEEYAKRIGAQLWVEHDYAAFSKQRKSPAYYE